MSKPSGLSLSPFSKMSPDLVRLNKVLATTSGQDKAFMLYAYGAHLVNFVLRSKRLANPKRLDLADRVMKLQALISDARVLYRLFGIFPIILWNQSLNDPATAPKDNQLKLIQRLQCIAMLIYYPLEHTYYLAGKGILSIKPTTIGFMALWSVRFWASYVVLQFFAIRRQSQLLKQSKSSLRSLSSAEEKKVQSNALRAKESALWRDLWVQIGYLPLTMHWSVVGGLLPSQTWVGACGTLAAAVGLNSAWKATA